jgi:membrane-bound serine protease (ClpP class)
MRTRVLILALLASFCRGESRIVAVNVDGVIHPITVDILARAIHQAASEHAEAILLRLNTPGGLLDATRECIQKIVSSPVPVIAFVTPSGGRAASAGFFLLEAGDVAAMAAGTNTGASSPVELGGQMDAVMRKKVENDTAALLRSLATKRGRNAELAEKAVFDAKSFTDQEALRERLIDLAVSDETQLFSELDGREITRFDGRRQTLHLGGARVSDYRLTVRQRIVDAVADPNIAFILLVLGALGIYIEFSSPGLIFPGVAGGILVLLGLSGLSALPIRWTGAGLLLLALAFFILEAKFTSHGILGIGGAVAMVLGALLLVQGPPEMRIRLSTALAVAVPFAAITMFLVSLVLRSRTAAVATGASGMLNEIGTARTELTPAGKVFVHGEYWDALSSAPVPAGARIRVVGIKGLTLQVEPVSEASR